MLDRTEHHLGALIGRDALMARLRTDLDAGRSVVLRGPAGVGKSRLLHELHRSDSAAGDTASRIGIDLTASSASAALPLAIFVSLIDDPHVIDLSAAARIRSVLVRSDGPISVDDAHLLDDASAGLLLDVARAGRPIVFAVRVGERLPLAIDALLRDEIGARREVEGLTLAEVRELTASIVARPVAVSAAAALHTRCAGNPLFIRELVAQVDAAGGGQVVRGEWALVEPLPLLQNVQDLLTIRVESMTLGHRRLLEYASIADPLRLDDAELLTDAETIDSTEALGLVRLDGQVLRPGHPLYRDAALVAMRPDHRRRRFAELLHARLQALAERPLVDDDRVRLALWRLQADQQVSAEELLNAAALVQASDPALWDTLIDAARSRASRPEDSLRLAGLLLHRHRVSEAESAIRFLDADRLPHELQIALAMTRSFAPALLGAEPHRALPIIDAATRRFGRIPVLEAQRSTALWRMGRLAEAAAAARAVRDDRSADAGARTHAGLTAFSAVAHLRDPRQAARARLALAPLITQAGADLPEARASAELIDGLLAAIWREDVAAGARLADAGYEKAIRAGDVDIAAQWVFLRASVALLAGSPMESLRRFREVPPQGMWQSATAALVLSRFVVALALAGDGDEATRMMGDLRTAPHPPIHDCEVAMAEAVVLLRNGQRAEAAARADRIGTACWTSGSEVWAVHAWFLGTVMGSREAAARLAQQATGRSTAVDQAKVRCAAAAVTGDAAELECSADDLSLSGLHWYAVEAQLLAVAAADPTQRAPMARRLRERMALCPGLHPLAESQGSRDGLTPREREIAGLAKAGLRDRAIADTLGISVRTVNTHLARVYSKLAIEGRRALMETLEG